MTAVAGIHQPHHALSGGGSTSPSISVPAGTAVTDTATLSGTNAASAGGTVTYSVYSDNNAATSWRSPGHGHGQRRERPGLEHGEPLDAGHLLLAGHYSGDTRRTTPPRSSTCGSEVETVTARRQHPPTSPRPSRVGARQGPSISVPAGTAVTDTATLSGTNVASAGGTVTYSVYSDNKCSDFVAGGGTVTVSAGSVPASSAVSLSTPGTYYWQASYSGDTSSNNAASIEHLWQRGRDGDRGGRHPPASARTLSGGGSTAPPSACRRAPRSPTQPP